MNSVFLDGGRMVNQKEAHVYLAEMLGFPETYGHNLDALFDCLTSMPDSEITILYSSTVDPGIRNVMLDAYNANPKLELYLA